MEQEKDKEVQKALSKLISDEWFAGNTYKMFIAAMTADGRRAIGELMLDVAKDELDDHLANLVHFALENGYDIPVSYNEMKKLADKEDIKLFESCKKGEDYLWYLGKGVEAEERAIKEYEKYIDNEKVN